MGVGQKFTHRMTIWRDQETGYDDYGNKIAPVLETIGVDVPCYYWTKEERRMDTQQNAIINETVDLIICSVDADVQNQDVIEVFDRRGERLTEKLTVDGRPRSVKRYKKINLVAYHGV